MATYRVMSGTWYDIEIPDEKVNMDGYSPEELYAGYFDGEIPVDVFIEESECDHIWESELK
jgi:hypothetical protein